MVEQHAIRPVFGLGLLGSLTEYVEIQRIVTVFKEGEFTPVATLGSVMRNAGNDRSWKAAHSEREATLLLGVS